ncbi:MAG: class I SAM-dependent methyltransferase [Silicimonas sp.]|nr:class I SAM-dependent methyltransferase [Silicimonas sp.]
MRPYRLAQTLFDATLGRLPAYRAYSGDLNILGDSRALVARLLAEERAARPAPSLLDAGARRGELRDLAPGFAYQGIDLSPEAPDIIRADICACPDIASDQFDVTLSCDLLEHVRQPFSAASELLRVNRPGGLLIHRTLFAYRYHPFPADYWRFSAEGLERLFLDAGDVETVLKGYDIRARRRDARGHPNWRKTRGDRPPIDYLGGWRENWRVLWVGRKRGTDRGP